MNQLSATLEKNFIEKRRNPCTTFFEYFSHLLICLLLVAGYGLSTVKYSASTQYDVIRIVIPPQFINPNIKLNADNFQKAIDTTFLIPTAQFYLSQPLFVPSFDQYVTVARFLTRSLSSSFSELITRANAGKAYGNLLKFGGIHFAPYPSPYVDSYISYMLNTTTTFRTVPYYVHASEGAAVEYILNNLQERTFALIVFRQVTPTAINYLIRQNYSVLPNTNVVNRPGYKTLYTQYQNYYLSGFLTMQDTVDRWAFLYTNTSLSNRSDVCSIFPALASVPFPTYKSTSNSFYASVGPLLGLALTMALLYPMSRMVKSIVEEKETKMREILKIMGLTDTIHSLSWVITAFILFSWIGISIAVITKITFLKASNFFILLVYFYSFSMSVGALSFLVSVFFSNSKLAAICGPVVLVFTILPKFIFFGTETNEGVSAKLAASIMSPTAFSLGADIIAYYESITVGVQFSNLNDTGYNLSDCIALMIVDFFIYGFLAWYFDQVLPHEFGPSKHPLFLFLPSYWLSSCRTKKSTPIENDQSSIEPLSSTAAENENCLEALQVEQKEMVRVVTSGLRKEYADGKVAVKSLNLSLLENQITCLLGHNGAGKSTTISILTGLTIPTAGECHIYGYKLSEQLASIRKITGICPQQNVLFPSLTVREHLKVFGSIKGLKGKELYLQMDELIAEVGLQEKANVLSKALSGGMKRKLCLAMALIGNPSFVLLDEPTSGMDPFSRRAIWDILQRRKQGRVILLTTHYLDEADIVSDRIAILSEGSLRCSGSSLFLKNRFGAGYMLSLAKTDIESHDKDAEITLAVQSVIPTATLTTAHAGELIYRLPIETSSLLGTLFAYLQQHRESLGVSSFGVSITSLEQVFISLAQENKQKSSDLSELTDTWLGRSMKAWTAYFSTTTLNQSVDEEEQHNMNAMKVHPQQASDLLENHESCDESARESKHDDADASDFGLSIDMVDIDDESKEVTQTTVQLKEESKEETKDSDGYIGTETNPSIKSDKFEPIRPSDAMNDEYPTRPPAAPLGLPFMSTKETTDLAFKELDSSERLRVHFIELLRKRCIISSRDLKGFFFQIIFPAVQILAVLALLTIVINPVGHTLRLMGSSYVDVPTVLIGGASGPVRTNYGTTIRSSLNQQDYTSTLLNSSSMSKYLLRTFKTPHLDRYASLLTNNTIPLNVTVDFTWVKDNLPFFLTLPQFSDFLSHTIGSRSFQFSESTTKFESQLNKFLLGNSFNISLFQSVTIQQDNVTNALGLNVTLINQLLLQGNITAIEQLLNSAILAQTNASTVSGQFSFTKVVYDPTTNSFILEGVEVTIDAPIIPIAVVIPLNNVTVSVAQLLSFLPDGRQFYRTSIPVPYTVMHNSTSPHGVAMFNGELRAAYFETCSPGVDAQATLSPASRRSLNEGNKLTKEKKLTKENKHLRAAPVISSESVSSTIAYIKAKFVAKNHPLPLTDQQTLENQILLAFFACLFILVPLCYIPAAFVSFLVRERSSKAKHIQIVSSVDPRMYWVSSYVFDSVLFFALDIFVMVAFFIYNTGAAHVFVGNVKSAFAVFLLLFVYGQSILPLCYMYSMAFENPSTCQISVTVINFFTGFILVLAYFIMVNDFFQF